VHIAEALRSDDSTCEVQTRLALSPHGRRRYSLVVELDQHLAQHQSIALEVVLYQSKDPQRPVGSLGIVVRGDNPKRRLAGVRGRSVLGLTSVSPTVDAKRTTR
jgi:hypothetical protein